MGESRFGVWFQVERIGQFSLLDTLLAFSAFKEDGEPIRERLSLDAKMVELSNLAALDHSFLHSVRLQLTRPASCGPK